MFMRVHHINCATMCPVGRRLVNGDGCVFEAGRTVCHCLVIESEDGLVLVDTGLGLDDVADAKARLGRGFVATVRPRLDERETAARQIERLGFRDDDVRHIVLTHLDLDHAGGLPDFPQARVHVHDRELDAVLQPRTRNERLRYIQAQWAHGPHWVRQEAAGETWFGFDAVRALPGVGPEVLLIPLFGHTRGHCGVAVDTGRRWIFHAGDAFFFRGEVDPMRPTCPLGLAAFQRAVAVDNVSRLANQARLRELVKTASAQVDVICAHCPATFDRLAGAAPEAAR
jgi:glyoxylase-like metal-dependent hydrolase (beta-lactamase superfamily II)